jgi:hypothetical protein
MSPLGKAAFILSIAAAGALLPKASAFCGFYVAQADTNLFNHASKVVLVRDGDHTSLTMSNDYKGETSQFAVVIPVPTVIERKQIEIADAANIDWIDQYSAPRLVEYYDPDPCAPPMQYRMDEMAPMAAASGSAAGPRGERAHELGVTVERSFTVGEYDIVILKAEAGSGLETWLHEQGYHVPTGATNVLQSYIRQNMHFFVAKVNLGEQKRLGQTFLRPIKVSYDSPKFMLPIRLGMANADGPQELFIFTITKKGRVEATNYRTTKIPTDLEIPPYVQQKFGDFYKDMFSRQVEKQGMETVFLEYGWPMTQYCDPCTAEMPTSAQLQAFGATWNAAVNQDYHGGTISEGYITRLHVRYDMAHFPEDLVFQETADADTFQGRYIINHTFDGDTTCEAGRQYEKALADRQSKEVSNLSDMTGWLPADIRGNLPRRAHPAKPASWWEQQ